ncbi:glycosyltransferase [Sphaerotilus sp.]|uniref:glycosyltransferase n=1 Tax=Sphaerotilus sp. TaxID=2093942 RepID=UPI00286E4DEE|nr:glycosyltransferase [Sphaerotilus sp.]
MLSIITATFNCQNDIKILINSLEGSRDSDFEWIVVDGASTDSTLSIVEKSTIKNKKIISEPDFGIYDALNKGVKMATGDYYIVLGADDIISRCAIGDFKSAINKSNADFYSARVKFGSCLLMPGSGSYWKRGGNAYVSSHAVGTCIKKSLHNEIGFYKNSYPNCADMYFICKAVISFNKKIESLDFVAGIFGDKGLSSVNKMGSILDAYKISIDLGGNYFLCTAILFYRLFLLGLCI